MPLPVKLSDLINELEAATEQFSQYLDKRTGEIFMVSDEEMAAAEKDEPLSKYPDWQRETILKAREILQSDHFATLPDRFEINDYKIMEEFCATFEDEQTSERLLRLIKGQGAFRLFRAAIQSLGIENAWYEFRRRKIEEFAIEWLELEGIPYTQEEDVPDISGKVM
jgi:hypothetical protein